MVAAAPCLRPGFVIVTTVKKLDVNSIQLRVMYARARRGAYWVSGRCFALRLFCGTVGARSVIECFSRWV